MTPSRYTDFALYRRLMEATRPYWLHITALLLLSLVSTPLALLTPLPLKIAVDSAIGSRPLPNMLNRLMPGGEMHSYTAVLLLATGLLVAFALLTQLQDFSSWVLRAYTGERMVLGFRAQLFRHVQRLSLAYHDTKGTTDSAYRIQYDAPSIQYITIDGVIPVITAGCTLAAMIYVTARLDWQLALIAIAVSPVLVLISHAYSRRLRSRYDEMKELDSSALAVVQEVLSTLRVVKAFGRESHEQRRFVRHSNASIRARICVALGEGSFTMLVGLTTALGMGAVLMIGMHHVRSGVLSLGDLLLVMGYLAQLYIPLQTISKKAVSMQSYLASAERAFALLDHAPDVVERPHARSLSRASGAVTFRDVGFAYASNRTVLRDISFHIEPGACVGITGRTGAGKTTLVSLLTRFYDPDTGEILLDGVDVREYKLVDLRNQFAIVPQEPVLFSTSIAENIAYARPAATHDEIVAAALASNAHDFIVGLPQGYQAQVGERGMRLSGGERQRISLARAFLKDAPILLLDEPTSSVDVKTEAMIMDAMERLMHGRTTFLIAHRLSTLDSCDVRLELEQGRLVSAVSMAPQGAGPAWSR